MNLSVSDDQVIVNIQGIRNVTWGESRSMSYSLDPSKPWFLTVTYKGSHNIFYYKTEHEVRSMYNKIREAMDKSYREAESNWIKERTEKRDYYRSKE